MTGATGQDGYYLVQRLIGEGTMVHAIVRDRRHCDDLRRLSSGDLLTIHEFDLNDADGYRDIVRAQPDEFYNLAGQSSVSASFLDPTSTWRTNADAVQLMLEAIRLHSPETRFYQASTTEMFGAEPGQTAIQDETSPLMPQSPYAAAKAAAHVVCDAYRRAFGLRVAAGILANHESRRRPATFLTRKVADHVRGIRAVGPSGLPHRDPLAVGNLAAQRDWGFAPDYVDGMVRILRQIEVRARNSGRAVEPDLASNYRDYVLGSGRLHAVWELVDRTFALAGLELEWDRGDLDPASWSAVFRATGTPAVVVDPDLLRPTDPAVIRADPSRARHELGWVPQPGLDRFLRDMLADDDVLD